jgi:hypothetical protein
MKIFFILFLRLFICLVAAKFFLRILGKDILGYLIGLTALLMANAYCFDYLAYRDRHVLRRRRWKENLPPPNVN